MIKSILIRLLLKYGSKLIFEIIEKVLELVADNRKTKFTEDNLKDFRADEENIKKVIDENINEVKSIVKAFKK